MSSKGRPGERNDGEEPLSVDRDGIYIERELADSIAMEEELDANIEGEYSFPDPRRRQLSGWVFLAFGVLALLSIDGGWPVALGFGLLGAWQFLASWPLAIDEHEALAIAGGQLDFAIGHASASVRFHGWRSRPRWSVVLYSATEPPDRRALVVVDAVSGEVVEQPYIEVVTPV